MDGARDSVVMGVGQVTKRLLFQILWSLDVMCCALRQCTLGTGLRWEKTCNGLVSHPCCGWTKKVKRYLQSETVKKTKVTFSQFMFINNCTTNSWVNVNSHQKALRGQIGTQDYFRTSFTMYPFDTPLGTCLHRTYTLSYSYTIIQIRSISYITVRQSGARDSAALHFLAFYEI